MMYYNNEIISYLQSNKILALKLDHALSGVGKAVASQIETIGAGAQRALYYTSCFTDEYQDVCKKQKNEDIRFTKGVTQLLHNGNIVYDMLKIYFHNVFKYKTNEELERIKQCLMAANVHIAASSLTSIGFAMAAATAVSVGLNLNLEMSALAGRRTGNLVGLISLYGIVQRAADSAQRLHFRYPEYYSALYAHELEMMYFLIEPLFDRSGALDAEWASSQDVASIITKMIS